MPGLVGVVGARSLPASFAGTVSRVVGDLLRRGCQVGSGGALGTDLFALQAVVASGCCEGARVFLPGSVQQAPWVCRQALQSLVAGGGEVVPGSAPVGASRGEFIKALFARSAALAQAATGGVVGFVSGTSSGTWFTCQVTARLGRAVVVFPVEGPGTAQVSRLRVAGLLWQPGRVRFAGCRRWQWVLVVATASRFSIAVGCQHRPLHKSKQGRRKPPRRLDFISAFRKQTFQTREEIP